MDTDSLTDTPHVPGHVERRRSQHAFPVLLGVVLLVLGACASFAIVMTNGPDYRAAAQPFSVGGTDVSVTVGAPDRLGPLEPLEFNVALANGPIALGDPGQLVISVSNPTDRAIEVDALVIDVLEPSTPGCRAEWFTLRYDSPNADAPLLVDAGGSSDLSVAYTLVDLAGTNQDACQGATFPLSIRGSGRPV